MLYYVETGDCCKDKRACRKAVPTVTFVLTLASSILENLSGNFNCHLIPTSLLSFSTKLLSGSYSKCTQSNKMLLHAVPKSNAILLCAVTAFMLVSWP